MPLPQAFYCEPIRHWYVQIGKKQIPLGCYTRDHASDYRAEVKNRVAAPKLTRVFILRSLVSLRKHRKRRSVQPSTEAV